MFTGWNHGHTESTKFPTHGHNRIRSLTAFKSQIRCAGKVLPDYSNNLLTSEIWRIQRQAHSSIAPKVAKFWAYSKQRPWSRKPSRFTSRQFVSWTFSSKQADVPRRKSVKDESKLVPFLCHFKVAAKRLSKLVMAWSQLKTGTSQFILFIHLFSYISKKWSWVDMRWSSWPALMFCEFLTQICPHVLSFVWRIEKSSIVELKSRL